jgi:hypothetical protein
MMDFVLVCIRIPKSASTSLDQALAGAFADRRTFFMPDTLRLKGEVSPLEKLRALRARSGKLKAHYGSTRLDRAIEVINAEARPGDLISGDHFDFGFVRQVLPMGLRMITLLRDPTERCLSEYDYARRNHLKRDIFKRMDAKPQAKAAARYSFVGYLDWLLEHRGTYGDLASLCVGWDGREPLGAYCSANVFHAGVLEDREAFSKGLADKLGRRIDFPWVNSTEGRECRTADTDARRRIEALYPKDMELYAHMRANGSGGCAKTF